MSKEVPPGIVIEAGSSFTRLGLAGDHCPYYVLSSEYAKDGDDLLFANDLFNYTPNKEIFTPVIEGVIHDWDPTVTMWKKYIDEIGLEPQEQPLVLVEQPWNPRGNKCKAMEMVFEDMSVPVFSLVKSPLCAAFQSARTSVIVIDVGASGASVTPIIDGAIIHKALMRSRLGGDFLAAEILHYLESKNIPVVPQYQVKYKEANLGPGEPSNVHLEPKGTESYHNLQISRLIDQFNGCVTQVSPTAIPTQQVSNPASAAGVRGGVRAFEFPTGYNVLFGAERFNMAEPLFKPSTSSLSLPENSLGISEMLYQSLNKVDASPEIMTNLLSNIVVCGGTTLLTGFCRRIENDLLTMLPNYQCKFHIEPTPRDRVSLVWTGASILGSIGTYDDMWVSKEEYAEVGADQLVEKRFK